MTPWSHRVLFLLVPAIVVILPLACSFSARDEDKGEACGAERWAIKTMSDPDAGRVNLTPAPSTVNELRALKPPKPLPNTRIEPVELTTFVVTAQVVEYKIEDDKDIHVVIADLTDRSETMIVELPNAEACAGADHSAETAQMSAAREALIAAFGQPKTDRFTALNGVATFTGVGFFDFKHGQRGVAPNAIELHPILRFSQAAQP